MAAPLTNPSFETGDLTGWDATSGVVVSSAPHVFSGTYGAHIPDGITGVFTIEQTNRYPAFEGLTFDATAYYEQGSAPDGRNTGLIYARWYDADGNIVGFQNGNLVTSSRTGPDWHPSTVHAHFLEGAVEVAIGWYTNKDNNASVHIDAFSWTYPDLPSIDLTYPINGGTYEAGVDVPYRVVIGSSTTFIPESVTYKAENTVTSVVTDVGTVTADPWALNSAALPAGTYNVHAEVTFQGGFTADSDIHALTIGTPPPPDTREFKASNAYTYLVAENFNRLASNIPSTALVTGVELVLDYNLKALLRTKDLGLPDPSAARYEAAFTMVPSGTFEMVLLNKSGTDYTQQGSTITQQVDILRADFSVTEDGTSENKRWTVLNGTADSVTVGNDTALFGIPTIPASEFTTKSIGLRFYPNLAPKPDFADTGDACFRVNLDKMRLRVYFDAGSVEYYFASPDKTQVIKGKLAAYCLDSGAFENGDAAGDMQLTPDLEVMDGTQTYIGGDWTIHSAYPPTDLNEIGNVDTRTDFTTLGMSYNGLPGYRAVLNNRSRYQFISANFYGDESLDSIYGVHGLPRAFAYNGEFFYKICTQPDPAKDSPRHVAYHHGHLALGYKEGRVDISVVGEPYNFSGVDGASSWAVGDRVVGLSELSGAILGVFGSKSITGISGTTVDNFATQVLSPNVGAIEYTVTDMGYPVYANAYGVYTLAQTAQYGDYLGSPMSQPVSPWLRPRLVRRMTSAKEVEVAWPVRSKNQYRLAFKDGYILSMTMNNGLQSAPTFSFQKYFWDDDYVYTPSP